jgi:alpha-1,2-mannosyltransferase
MSRMARWRSLSHAASELLSRPPRARIVAWVVVVASTVLMLWSRLGEDEVHWLVDLQVYQGAGVAVRNGHSLYSYATPFPQRLPFTYPPFGGLLAIPLSLLSRYPLGIVWTGIEFALCLFLARKLFRPLIDRAGPLAPVAFAAAVVLTEWIVPVRDTFYFGQVNLFLVALVVVDLTVVRGRWPRGLLVGIAAAIKLTPALFIPYLWMTGRRRMAGVAAATFAGGQLLAAAILPSDSREYWTHTVFEGSRLGLNTVVSNQSIRGFLLRFALPSPYGSLIWVVLAAPVAVIGLRRAKQAYADGAVILSIGLTGLTAALISPVSWIHHFLWILLVIAALAGATHDRRALRWAACLATVFLLNIPQWGEILVRGSGSYVLGRLLQETYLVLTLIVVTALPWPRQILASVDAVPSPSTRKEALADDGEAASRPVVTP